MKYGEMIREKMRILLRLRKEVPQRRTPEPPTRALVNSEKVPPPVKEFPWYKILEVKNE